MSEEGDYWILDGHRPVATDGATWARSLGGDSRRVAHSEADQVRVSTVFLGMDHQWKPGGPPLLFETMIFGGPNDGWQDRCSTWEQAIEMHKAACELVAIPYPVN